MEAIQAELINLVILVIAGMFGVVSKYIVSFLKKKGLLVQLQNNKEITNVVVDAIEQTYMHLQGSEKLELAKLELIKLSKLKGLKITEKELDLLIESSVKGMNKGIKDGMK